MSGNLQKINKQILLPVLEKTFFHQRLAFEVKKYVPLFSHSALVHIYICQIVQGLLEKLCAMKVAYDKYDLVKF